MENFIATIELIFTDLWNYFYVFLCHLWDKDVDENLIVKDEK